MGESEIVRALTNAWTWIFGGGAAVVVAIFSHARSLAADRATRDHVALETSRRTAAENDLAQSKQRIDQMTQEISKLHERLTEAERFQQFDEESGVLFKRRVGGGYHDAVYCPKCLLPMMQVQYGGLYCDSCKWRAPVQAKYADGLRLKLTLAKPPQAPAE